jgi:O-acetyl-ADP-ribose deacetylase (regulator of RNase III)
MAVKVITGNLFTSQCQTLVNTVNCVGVMGAGIALEFRLRQPALHTEYKARCERGDTRIGEPWLYTACRPWVLNFPTKTDWRKPSRLAYLEQGLHRFAESWRGLGITSIAFPILGAANGGIPTQTSLELMQRYLGDLELPVEIYRYSREACDELYVRFREWLLGMDERSAASVTGVRISQMRALRDAVQYPEVCQLNQLAAMNGIGLGTLERVFRVAQDLHHPGGEPGAVPEQMGLQL